MEANRPAAVNARSADLSGTAGKAVNIEITDNDLDKLRNENYSLCFARKVNNSYNVVWKAEENFLLYNSISWSPLYQLFGTNTFRVGRTVKVITSCQNCDLGQTCTLDANGSLSLAENGGSKTALHLKNEYSPMYFGANQLITGITGREEILPIYVGEQPTMIGTEDLTPKESVLVWFEQNIQTSTMFMSSRPNAIELDLAGRNSVMASYVNGEWEII